jgi:hypothetical protein
MAGSRSLLIEAARRAPSISNAGFSRASLGVGTVVVDPWIEPVPNPLVFESAAGTHGLTDLQGEGVILMPEAFRQFARGRELPPRDASFPSLRGKDAGQRRGLRPSPRHMRVKVPARGKAGRLPS